MLSAWRVYRLKCYCEGVRNITVSVDEETYKRARIKAAELDTSVSRLVRDFLHELSAEETEFERLARQELELRSSIESFRASDRLSRDEVHARKR